MFHDVFMVTIIANEKIQWQSYAKCKIKTEKSFSNYVH